LEILWNLSDLEPQTELSGDHLFLRMNSMFYFSNILFFSNPGIKIPCQNHSDELEKKKKVLSKKFFE